MAKKAATAAKSGKTLVVEQVGSPMELYRRPGNLFVAQFIGSPAMNILPAKVDKTGATTEVTVTAGATQAIFTALLAVVHPGDEVYEHMVFDGQAHQRLFDHRPVALVGQCDQL